MIYGEAGVIGITGVGGGGIYDNDGNLYLTEDVSLGESGLISGEACAVSIISLDSDLVLTPEDKMKIITGPSTGVTAYLGAGGGVSVPTEGDYVGKVAIIKSGIGSPQISVGGGITELFWKCVESWKERRMESVLDEP